MRAEDPTVSLFTVLPLYSDRKFVGSGWRSRTRTTGRRCSSFWEQGQFEIGLSSCFQPFYVSETYHL